MAKYLKPWPEKPGTANASGIWQNSINISSNVTIESNYNGLSAGPVSIASGVSVTIPTGSTWTIV